MNKSIVSARPNAKTETHNITKGELTIIDM